MFENEIHAPFWEHVEELRKVIIRCFLIVGIGFLVAFSFYDKIFSLVTQPYFQTIPSQSTSNLVHTTLQRDRVFNPTDKAVTYFLPNKASVVLESSQELQEISSGVFLIPPGKFLDVDLPKKQRLVLLGPLEGITVALKTSLWIGIAVTSPFWMVMIMQFISPALHKKEKRLVTPFLIWSFVFLTSGVLFAFFLTIPLANIYLHAFNNDLGTNLWSLSSYVNYTLTLLIANAIAFEFALLLFFLVHLKVFSAKAMAEKRRHFIVFAFILAALLTPPDVLTQFLLAIPLIALYELAIVYAKVLEKKAKKIGKQIEVRI